MMLALYLDGYCLEGEQLTDAKISIADRGLLLGDGLFETLPMLDGTALWWQDHRTRLLKTAERIGLPIDSSELDKAVLSLQGLSPDPAILRLTVTRGVGGRGLLPGEDTRPTILATLLPLPRGLAFQPASLITSSIRRNEFSPSSSMKSVNYLDNILASKEANKTGADDALFLNTRGNAACTTICNLFVIKAHRLITPPVSEGSLPGIMRQKILDHARQWRFEVSEEALTLQHLQQADGLFLTNSLRYIRQVTRLDDHAYPALDLIGHLQAHIKALVKRETGITPE